MKLFLAGVILSAASSVAYADQFNQGDFQLMKTAANVHQGFYMSLSTIPPFEGGVNTGYLFNPHFGLEAGVDAAWGFDILQMSDVEIYHLEAKSIVALGSRFELFGKLGLGYIVGTSQTIPLPPYIPSCTQTSSTFGLAFGAGLGFSFTPRWVLSVEGNGIVNPKTGILKGGVGVIPTIGITHYLRAKFPD